VFDAGCTQGKIAVKAPSGQRNPCRFDIRPAQNQVHHGTPHSFPIEPERQPLLNQRPPLPASVEMQSM